MCASAPAETYVKSKTDLVSSVSPLSAWEIPSLRQGQVLRYFKKPETAGAPYCFLTQETKTFLYQYKTVQVNV